MGPYAGDLVTFYLLSLLPLPFVKFRPDLRGGGRGGNCIVWLCKRFLLGAREREDENYSGPSTPRV